MTTRLPPGSHPQTMSHIGVPDGSRAPDDRKTLPDAMKQEPHFTEALQVVRTFFQGRAATLVSGDSPVYYTREDGEQGVVWPDCYVAFGVDGEAILARNGYFLNHVGQPPDFVLEIASESTHSEDTGRKRDLYARLGIGEYWRFDPTGGDFYGEALVGERLVDREYRRIELQQDSEGIIWGCSEALGLDLCWDSGRLRFYDPTAGAYLRNLAEAEALIAEAEALIAEAEVAMEAERSARRNAEAALRAEQARIRRLEEELRRHDSAE